MNDTENTCGCGEGVEKSTPLTMANRPGLNALAYRVGTHASFLETMQARLSDHDYPELAGLKTRDPGDAAMALLDAWATVAEVLTFYQERLVNEGYLRTATERRSILELARLVGYDLRPGVAASAYLAFTVEDVGHEVEIPAGTRAQSLPGPGELPQSFETSEKLIARPEWNNLRPRMTRPQTEVSIKDISGDNRFPRVYLKGIATNLTANDPLLIDFGRGGDRELFRVIEVKPDAVNDRTEVKLQSWSDTGQHVLKPLPAWAASVRRIVDNFIKLFSDPKQFDHLDDGVIKEILGELHYLRDRLRPEMPGPELNIQSRLSLLAIFKEQADLSQTVDKNKADKEKISQYARLSSLLGNLIAELNQAITPNEDDRDDLRSVLPHLTAPASTPPRNALRLEQNINAAYSSHADMGLNLLKAFRPDLRDALPTAVANTRVTEENKIKVYALRVKASLFGHNAPKEPQYEPSTITKGNELPSPNPIAGDLKPQAAWFEWIPAADEAGNHLFLDTEYNQILLGSYVVILTKTDPTNALIFENIAVQSLSRHAYGISGKTTQITLPEGKTWWSPDTKTPNAGNDPEKNKDYIFIRGTTVYAQSEELFLAEEPIADDICGGAGENDENAWIELDSLYSDLKPGNWLIVSGERTDIKDVNGEIVRGVMACELLMLSNAKQDVYEAGIESPKVKKRLPDDKTHTFVKLANSLGYCYKRDTVTIYGNVVKATHGETRNEVLGSGDGSKALQQFELKQSPLTYVAASNPTGVDSTLRTIVNDLEWHEADSLAGLPPTARGFIKRTDDEGKTTIIFGNGKEGSRLPTGVENVTAVYRNGIGKAGNVKAEQISLLATKPLGAKSVINPLRASGGADKESRDQARGNAPLAVMALDRLVSVQDYADFARTFAGIGKANAVRLSDGRREVVHVTIAGAEDIPIDETSDLFLNLRQALLQFGDPYQPMQLAVRELKLLVINTNVRVLPDYQWEAVVTKVRTKLLDSFSFERRELGQDVKLSEVISMMQRVEGVAYVDVDVFGGIPEKIPNVNGERHLITPQEIATSVLAFVEKGKNCGPLSRVQVNMADFEQGAIRPAQIAYFTPEIPDTIILNRL